MKISRKNGYKSINFKHHAVTFCTGSEIPNDCFRPRVTYELIKPANGIDVAFYISPVPAVSRLCGSSRTAGSDWFGSLSEKLWPFSA